MGTTKYCKIIVAGQGGVGKTCFLTRLIHDKYDPNSELTRGFGFFSYKFVRNTINYNLIFWDLAGQSHFKDILTTFAEGSIAAFIMVDLSRISSLDEIPEWKEKIDKYGTIPIIILGTKYDIVDAENEKYIDETLRKYMEEHEEVKNYIKISSKTGYNIEEVLNFMIENLIE